MIDSTDIERLSTAADELAAMLNEEELRDAALLVFANKQDQPGAKGAGDISEALKLGELRDRNWSIVACSAIDGRGVTEGMDWLVVCLETTWFPGPEELTATANRTERLVNARPRPNQHVIRGSLHTSSVIERTSPAISQSERGSIGKGHSRARIGSDWSYSCRSNDHFDGSSKREHRAQPAVRRGNGHTHVCKHPRLIR